ncbi:MAG: hypothetical protein H7232_15600 [Aeromicrobium sp.]|nr:hypothetical protein [Burkholderiales bacterium]
MNKKMLLSMCIFGLNSMFPSANAFELATHGVLTNQAYASSALGTSSGLIQRLGLFDIANPFGENYYDFTSSATNRRSANNFEAKLMLDLRPDRLRIRGWLMRGAIREDDITTAAGAYKYGQPLDDKDPAGNINRLCNHFLNPFTRNALVAPFGFNLAYFYCEDFNFTAVDWAIGTENAFSANVQAAPNYRNHFTVFSAREAMWRALTLLNRDGTPAARIGGDTPTQVRNAYWATTFRALGDVLHLSQDMAQPQHTRNEPHPPSDPVSVETYMEARAVGDRTFKFQGTTLTIESLPPLPLNVAYPIPRFNRYSDYWSTAAGADSVNIGKGLADYSSRGFFTPNQSLGDPSNGLPRPVNMESAYTISAINTPVGGAPCPGLQMGLPTYAWASVPDSVSGVPSRPIRMANRGLLPSKWTIGRCVLVDQGDLLIPRAVAYSAGLIDYFFRGQLEITPPAEGIYSLVDHFDFSGAGKTATDTTTGFKGFKSIKLKLRNATPDITPSGGGVAVPQSMTAPGGTLVAVLKFYRNTKHTDDLANELANTADYVANRSTVEEIVVSSRVKDAGGNLLGAAIPITTTAQTFTFEFDQELPINATDVKLQVVYRGVLGSEADAVVVETLDISEPTFLSYLNASDYIHIGNGFYTRDQINAATPAGAALRSQIQPPSCIDGLTNQLANGCFQPFGVNFAMKFGTVTNTAVAGFAVPANKNFNRLGTLIPAGANVVMNLAANTSPCSAAATKVSPGATVQTDYELQGDGSTIPRITTSQVKYNVRGIRTHFVAVCTHNGDGVPHTADITQAQVIQLAIPADAKPLKLSTFNYGAL